MAEVVYSPNAVANLDALYRFLAERNPQAAVRAIQTIRDRLKTLSRFPRLGPSDPDYPDYRQLFIAFGATGHVARYRVDGKLVVVLASRHAREAGHTTD